MSKVFYFILLLSFFVVSHSALAEEGLIIHAAEIGIGKFHRRDNQVHPYAKDNIWTDYVLPEEATIATPLARGNPDGSVTVFFSSLEELLTRVIEVSHQSQKKIQVLNIEAHGLPGAMWFPVDETAKNSAACSDWVRTANGPDEKNYEQYYSQVSLADIVTLRIFAYLPFVPAPCTSGVKAWRKVVAKLPTLKDAFTSDAQLHFFSCTVGYGLAGSKFVSQLAALLFSGEKSKVEAAMNFGLGDWSMPEGMGFWDFKSLGQLHRDNQNYVKNKQDREMMQKGGIRMAEYSNGEWKKGILRGMDFMVGTLDMNSFDGNKNLLMADEMETDSISRMELLKNVKFPLRVHIPGTDAYFNVF
ncbi:MAG: hypothetical protein JWQ35_768 [Bacteriovoracaceae bacterium]|nr:hypothetical protein [Bacteriovoracaceae bacterium]